MSESMIERSALLRRVRGAGRALTTPLMPDDYLSLLNPLWSARELRGRVERVEPITDRSATLHIRPGWGWSFDHQPGQYVGIGVEIDGRFHWRSYSLSSEPVREGKTIGITVKAMPEGFLSEHLVKGLAPGTLRTIMKLSLPNKRTTDNPPPLPTRRKTDAERPARMAELGRWSRSQPAHG